MPGVVDENALLEATRTRLSSPPSPSGDAHEAPRVSKSAETQAFEGLPVPSVPVKSAPLLETHAYEPPRTTQALPGKKVDAEVARAVAVPTTKWAIEPQRPPEPDTFDLPLPGVLKRPMPAAPVAATRRLLPQDTQRRVRVDTGDIEELELDEELPPPPIAAPVIMAMPVPMPMVVPDADEPLPMRSRVNVLIALALAALTLIVLVIVTAR